MLNNASANMFRRNVFCLTLYPLVPVVEKVDSAIHWINLYPEDAPIGFPNTYPLDNDLSSG